ncbi:MAG: autotransporter-associated beta strand repeat-containing protein [Verrucomicrobiota bacterium]
MKPRSLCHFPRTLVVCVAPLLACVPASARVIVTNEAKNLPATWTFPSGTNLLTDPVSLTAPTNEGSSNSWHTLIDNSLGDTAGGTPGTSCAPGNGGVVTFPLDLTGHAGGRDITSFDSYCAWGSNGRDDQDYTLQYSTVADPTTFITISAVSARTQFNASGFKSTHARMTSSDGFLATGAHSLRVIFNNQENGYTGFREFIALDTPVVACVNNEKNNTNVWPFPTGNILTAPSGTANTNEGSDSNWGRLIDGSLGDHNVIGTSVAPGNGDSVVFPLDLTGHPGGRDITTVDSYAAWANSGRDDQNYTLEYDTVANPGVYIPITAVANTSDFYGGNAKVATHTSITSNTGNLATGANSIRVTFNGQENGFTGFREFVVRDTPYATNLVNEANNTGAWTFPAGINLIGLSSGATVSSSASIHEGSSGSWDTVRDGSLGNGLPATSCTPNNNETVTFTLDTSVNTSGYNLTAFDSYCEWVNSGRDDQDYTLFYSTVSDPGTFIPLQVVKNKTQETKATHCRITPSSGFLATNVAAIQIRFFSEQENGYTGFREFIAQGSAVPLFSPLTWTGATNATWDTTANNWTGPYNVAAPLTFDTTGINRSINVPTAITAASLSFASNGTPFTFSGQPVTVTNDISSTGSGLATFGNSVTATTGVALTGSGSLVFNSDLTSTGVALSGTGSITLNASNVLLTGTVSVTNGLLSLTHNDAVAYASLSMTGGTAAFSTASPTVLSIGGTGGSIVLGNSTGPVNTFLSVGDVSTVSTGFAGSIMDAAGATSGLIKTADSTLTLTGDNTYTGETTVDGGTLEFGRRLSLYHGTPLSWTASNIVVNSGGTLGLAVGGIGEFTESDANTLELGGFDSGSALGLNTLTNTTLSRNLTQPGMGLVKTGPGILSLTGTNTSNGITKIFSGGVIAASSGGTALNGDLLFGNGSDHVSLGMGGSNQVASTSVFTFDQGNFYQTKINLRGTSQTIAGLDSAPAPANRVSLIQNDEIGQPGYAGPPVAASLTINATSDHSFYGLIRDNDGGAVSVTKTGPGVQEFLNMQPIQGYGYTGPTLVNEGTLRISFAFGNNGFGSNITVSAPATLGFRAARGSNFNFDRIISGDGNVVVDGTNAVILRNGGNSFSNGLTVDGGFLALESITPVGAGTGLGQTCVGGAMDPDNQITLINGGILSLDNTAPLGDSTVLPEFAPSILVNEGSKIFGGTNTVAFVSNITLDGGKIEITNGANHGGFGTDLTLVGTLVVGGTSTVPAEIFTSGAGANANASLGSVGAPGTTFQVADVAVGDDLTVSSILRNVLSIASPLTKTGPGTMLLSGANTYTGDTTVSEGELIVSGNSIPDTNKLILDGTGKLGLAANETVDTLFFGAVQQDSGTYGAIGSGADVELALFTGAGLLTVNTGLTVSYETWASAITNGLDDRAEDADGDGFTNLDEFLFGTSPVASTGSLSSVEDTGSTLIVRWCERLDSTSVYELQESTTLENPWPASGVTPTVDTNQTGLYSDSYVRKQAIIPIDIAKKFARVFATE